VAALAHQLGEAVPGPCACGVVEQAEHDGERVHGRSIRSDDAIVIDVVLIECHSGSLGNSSEMQRVVEVPEQLGGVGDDRC
jgi:hypothetical protein